MKLVIQDKQEGKYAEVDVTFFAIRELSRNKRSTLNLLIKKTSKLKAVSTFSRNSPNKINHYHLCFLNFENGRICSHCQIVLHGQTAIFWGMGKIFSCPPRRKNSGLAMGDQLLEHSCASFFTTHFSYQKVAYEFIFYINSYTRIIILNLIINNQCALSSMPHMNGIRS